MQIGNGFMGETKEGGKQYINLAFDKGLLAAVPQLNNFRITLWFVPKSERKKENSPQWRISLDEPYVPQEQTASADNEEIPY